MVSTFKNQDRYINTILDCKNLKSTRHFLQNESLFQNFRLKINKWVISRYQSDKAAESTENSNLVFKIAIKNYTWLRKVWNKTTLYRLILIPKLLLKINKQVISQLQSDKAAESTENSNLLIKKAYTRLSLYKTKLDCEISNIKR